MSPFRPCMGSSLMMMLFVAGCQKSGPPPASQAAPSGADATHAAPVETISEYFSPQGKKVTEATYPTAESSRQYLQEQSAVGVNNFNHQRVLTPTDKQTVARMNPDTYYSFGVPLKQSKDESYG